MLIVLLLAPLGCASQRSGAVHYAGDRCRSTNLAIGPTAEHSWISSRIGYRSDWPAVQTGVRLDSITYYSEIIYDQESHWNRYGGLYHGTETVHGGVWVR
jgi:hypothetical protein